MLWSAGSAARAVPAPGFTKDKNLVFAPHIYAESLVGDTHRRAASRTPRTVAQQHGVTVWGGEWGFWPEHPVDASDKIERYAAAEDAARVRRRVVGLEAGLRRPARRATGPAASRPRCRAA